MRRAMQALVALGVALGSVTPSGAQQGPTDREREIYRLGYERGFAKAKELALRHLRGLAESQNESQLATRQVEAERDALAAEVESLRAQLAGACPATTVADSGDAPGVRLLPVPVPVGPYGLGVPDPRLVQAGAGAVVAGVRRDVEVAGATLQEGAGVVGTWAHATGENMRAGAEGVGLVAGGYVEALQGLGEERSLLDHVGHTFEAIGGGWIEGIHHVQEQRAEGRREVGGRILEGAQEVGSTWVEGTGEVLDAVREPFSD